MRGRDRARKAATCSAIRQGACIHLLSCLLVNPKIALEGQHEENTMSAEARVKELKLDLPPGIKPVGNYVAGVRSGNLLFMSGVGPRLNDGSAITGKLGEALTVEQGYAAARQVGLNMLVNIRQVLGSLDKVKRVVKVLGMVNSVPTFNDTPKVMNGFSDLFVEVFGEAGRGARSAVGMVTLPSQISVEVEMVLEVE